MRAARHDSCPITAANAPNLHTHPPAHTSAYFWGAPVLSCRGRTFPVEVSYLEDVYAATNYALAPDSRAALRPGAAAAAAAAAQRKAAARGSGSKGALVAAGWGDDDGDGGPLNPAYDAELYAGYPERVRRNLRRVNEEVLDLDLIEDLVAWAGVCLCVCVSLCACVRVCVSAGGCGCVLCWAALWRGQQSCGPLDALS
jgi:hypothetical protein